MIKGPQTFFAFSGKKCRFDIAAEKEVVWMSKHDEWNNLYSTTAPLARWSGGSPRAINRPQHNRRRRGEAADMVQRQRYLSSQESYFIHCYRIGLDGSALTPLATTDASRIMPPSTDHAYYVDTYSRVTRDSLGLGRRRRRDARRPDGSRQHRCADEGRIKSKPEVFVARGRNSKTNIWGVIYPPTTFDASRRSTVIEKRLFRAAADFCQSRSPLRPRAGHCRARLHRRPD